MLTPEQRTKIQQLVAQGAAKAEIARRLKVSRSSVYRQLQQVQARGRENGEAVEPAPRTSGRNRALLAHLFEIFEDLRTLRDISWGMVPAMTVIDKFFSQIAPEDNVPGFEEWKPICVKIAMCLKRIEQLVDELRLDTPIFQRLYLEMLDVRTAWIRFLNSTKPVEVEEHEKLEPTVCETYLPILDRIISNLKKVIIGNRQLASEAPRH